jgi:Flp pilus assembly protein TadD
MQRHDYAAAELEYLELVRSMPDVAELRSNLGLSYYLQKKYQPAEEEF